MTRSSRFRLSVAASLALFALSLIFLAVHAQAHPLRAGLAPTLDVVVSEVAWMGTAASANDEWIELYNNTAAPIDLAGWTLDAADGTPSIPLHGVIPAGGHFLLERTDDSSVPAVPADLIYSGALGNEGETLTLRDPASALADRVDCSAGWSAGHNRARVPMARVDTATSGSLAANWTHSPRCGSATNSGGVAGACTLPITDIGRPLDYALTFNERFTATATTLDRTSLEDGLLALIDGASVSVEAALYGLDRQTVVTALIAAHGRGVAVHVVADDVAATTAYSPAYQALAAAGIPVVTDTAEDKLQHNKFLVVDGQFVWTGSANLTDTGLTLNANSSVLVTDTTLAAIYLAEFEEMWAGRFDGAKADDTPHLLDYDGTLVESYFSPTDLVAFEVWDALGDADETVHFATFFWTDDVLADRVIERLAAGVEVHGVWDAASALHPASVYPRLCVAGARIKVETFAGKLHHKFAVVDVEGSDPVVVLGSYNWTDGGAYDNDENTLIVHDRDLARAYHAEWQRLWSALDEDTLCVSHRLFLPLVIVASAPFGP
jgi:hypothetical protein